MHPQRADCWRIIAVICATAFLSGCRNLPVKTNLLENASFEEIDSEGHPKGWTPSYGGLKPGEPKPAIVVDSAAGGRQGEREARLRRPDSVEWVLAQHLAYRPLVAGDEYVFSVWLKADKPAEVDIYLAAVPAQDGIQHQGGRRRKKITASWREHEVALRINDDTKYVTLRCVVQLFTGGVVLSMDGARLSQGTGSVRTVTSTLVGCVFTDSPPVIDGMLTDACWAGAGRAGGFMHLKNRQPGEERMASEQTAVRLLYDEENLYLGFECLESQMAGLREKVTARDGPVHDDDCIEIFLAPEKSAVLRAYPGFGAYFHLIVNSLGTHCDGVGYHAVWNAQWEAKTAKSESEWSVEVKIPFTEVGTIPTEGDFWKATFCRHETRLEEFSSWSPLDEKFHEPRHFGTIGFVRDLNTAALLKKNAVKRAGEEIRRRYLSAASGILNRVQKALRDLSRAGVQEGAAIEVASGLEALRGTLEQTMDGLKGPSSDDLIQKQEMLREKNARLQRNCAYLCNRAWVAGFSGKRKTACVNGAYSAFGVKAVTDSRILPWTNVQGRPPLEVLVVRACPGEYEPVSFVVVGSRELSGVAVAVAELKKGERRLPADAVDVKLVKCWYQSAARDLWAIEYLKPKGKVLVPELLLNDDTLVIVDLKKGTNAVRVTDPETQETSYMDITGPNEEFTPVHYSQIKDAATLQPVDIPPGQCRQFWLTVHVPDNAVPGTYEGRVTVRAANAPPMVIPLRLEVYPFALVSPIIENAIYFWARMGRDYMMKTGYLKRPNEKPGNLYWNKNHVRLALENMRRHGIDAPSFFQTPFGERSMPTEEVRSYFDDYMEMLKETGYPLDRFFYCPNLSDVHYPGLEFPFRNYWSGDREEAEKRFKWAPGVRPHAAVYLNYSEVIKKFLLEFKAKAEKHGFEEFWFYFADEIMKHELPVTFPFLREYRKAGLRSYCAIATSHFIDEKGRINKALWNETLRSVDGLVFAQKLKPTLAALASKAGVRTYSYNNPQLGMEYPHTYRRNYGLALWKAGYSGGMDFCYTGSDWNDFNSKEYRDHNMVYPSADRMIDTLQWEGYREGVDDVRYLSTLLEAIKSTKKKRASARAQAWLESIRLKDTLGWEGFQEGVDDIDLDELRREIVNWIIKLE